MTVIHAEFGNKQIAELEDTVADAIDKARMEGVAPVTIIGLLHVYAHDVTASIIEESSE